MEPMSPKSTDNISGNAPELGRMPSVSWNGLQNQDKKKSYNTDGKMYQKDNTGMDIDGNC